MTKDNIHYRILVIEDNPGDVALIEEYLQEQINNPEILVANTFREAGTITMTAPDLDIVLLDLTLPDKSGQQLVEDILKLPDLNCPVIVLTGYSDVDFSKTAIALGASDYLLKDELTAGFLYKSIIYAIERHRTTLRLEESEKKFSNLFNLSPQPMWVYDLDTLSFVQVNWAAIQNYGYSEAEFLEMKLADISFDKSLADFRKIFNNPSPESKSVYSGITQHKKKSGELIDVEIHSAFVMVNHKPCRSVIAIDITERKKAEQELKNSQDRYRTAQAIGKMGNWHLNLDTYILAWSDEIFKIFDMPAVLPEMNYETFFNLIHPDDRDQFTAAQEAALAGKQDLDIVHRILTPAGNLCYVHELGKLQRDEEGKATAFIGTVQDVTQQTKNELALKQSEARLKGVIDSQTNYVIRTDLYGNYTYYNHNFFDEFGWVYGTGDLIGCNGLHSILEYDHDKVRQCVAQCMTTPNIVYQVEIDKPGKNNIIRTTLWDFVCLTDEHQNPMEIQCVGIDVTEWRKTERQIVKTLEERNAVLESIGDAFFAVDNNWLITYWNKEAERITGFLRTDLIGKNFRDSFTGIMNPDFFRYLQTAVDNNEPEHFENFTDTYQRWWDVTAFPSDNGLAVYFKDISTRKQIEEEIKNNERKLQVLFHTVREIIFMVSIESRDVYRFVSMNKAGLNAMGMKEEEVVGHYVHHIIPSPSLELVLSKYQQAITEKQTITWEETTPYPAGVKTARVSASPVFNDQGECMMLVGSIFDITDQLAYEEKLKASNDELRQLALHLQHVREEERLHIAREIHDELGQQLTGIKMDISWLKRKLPAADDAIKNKIQESIGLIDNTINTVRKIAAELRPSVLDDLGLAEAINWLSHEFTKRSGIPVLCNTNVDNQKYDPQISIAIFRIYQESLTNISRHAQATSVRCDLEEEDNHLRLVVTDNGQGFDLPAQSAKRTLGLVGIKERVANFAGTYRIESAPGKGTIVSVQIPL